MTDGTGLTETLTQALKIGVGATVQAVELLQDPTVIQQKLTGLQDEFTQGTLTETFASKGEKTVLEARDFIETAMRNQAYPPEPSPPPESSTSYPIDELAALRRHLEALGEQLRGR